MSKAAKATLPILNNKQQLNKIVVDLKEKPDLLAINLYWDEFRSWYNPKKTYTSTIMIKTPKIYKYGVYASYKELAKKFGVTENTIRRKIVKLEELGLLSRNFYINKEAHKTLYNQLVIYIWQQTPWFFNPIGLDRDLIKELTPSTNHEYISSKYNNKIAESVTNCHQLIQSNDDTPIIARDDTPYKQNDDTPHIKFVHTPTSLQASDSLELKVEGGVIANDDTPIITNDHTPIIARDDTNILRVNNLYTKGIERLFTVYNINNNTRARGIDEPSYVINFTGNELKTTNSKEQESSYADNAFDFLTESTQSAIDKLEESELTENETDDLLALLAEEPSDDFETPIDPEEVPVIEKKNRRMFLSKALCDALGTEQADEIQDVCKFTELEPDKINIAINGKDLTEWERAKIRQAIRSVYGPEVKIVTTVSVSIRENDTEENTDFNQSNLTPNWVRFKSTIKHNELFKVLNNESLKIIELQKKVIIEAVGFFIEKITEPGSLESLEDAIVETGLTLELHTKSIHPEYKNFNKEPIVLTPEKVLKDKAWFENMKINDLYKTSTVNRLIEVKEEKPVNAADEESVTIYDKLKSFKRDQKIIENFNDITLLALIEKQKS